MVRWLVWLQEQYDASQDWVDVKARDTRGGDYAKLSHWGLAQRRELTSPDATRTSGLWRPTARGTAFVRGELGVPSHVYLYNGNVLGFSKTLVFRTEGLSTDFFYRSM